MNDLGLFSTEHTRVRHASAIRLPGCLIVEPIRTHLSLGSMDLSEREDLMHCLAKAEGLVRAHAEAERVDTLRFDEDGERVQFYIVPRTPNELDTILKSRGDGTPANGAAIVNWLWSHDGELGYGATDVSAWLATVRAQLHADKALPEAWCAMASCATRYCDWIDSLPPRGESRTEGLAPRLVQDHRLSTTSRNALSSSPSTPSVGAQRCM